MPETERTPNSLLGEGGLAVESESQKPPVLSDGGFSFGPTASGNNPRGQAPTSTVQHALERPCRRVLHGVDCRKSRGLTPGTWYIILLHMLSDKGFLQVRSKADLVADLLREDIKRGELPPGAVLRQRDLAMRFGVSPTPVREALSRLEAEGFVTSELHRGATVVRKEESRVHENYVLRATLESLAVELATPRLGPEDLDKLSAINREIGRYKRVTPKVIELNRSFHMGIYQASELPLLMMLLQQLWAALGGGPRVDRSIEESVGQHEGILRALRERDAERAAELTGRHILSATPVLSADNGN
jgi:DNA-binding GntR family transcriptional regulator